MPSVFDFAVPGAKKIVRSVRPQMFRRGPSAVGVRQGPEGRPSEVGGDMPQLGPDQVSSIRERLRQRFGDPQFRPSGPMAPAGDMAAPPPPPMGMQDGGGGAAPSGSMADGGGISKEMSDGGAISPMAPPMKQGGGIQAILPDQENDPRKTFGDEISPRY